MQPVREYRHSDVEEPSDDRSARWATRLDPRRIVLWSLVLFVALRCCIVIAADTPSITPDEFGSWAMARFFGGHEALISMREMPRYPLISGVVLAPVSAIGLSPVTEYRLGLVVLSALTVAAADLVRRTLALWVPDRSDLAAVGFAVVLLFPATMVTGSFTWAEPTVVLWWSALALGVAHLAFAPSPRAIVAGGLVAGSAPFVHGRLSAVPLVWLAGLGWVWWARRRRRETGLSTSSLLLGAGVTLATAVLARSVDAWMAASVWDEAGSPSTDGIVSSMTSAPWWKALGAALLGQGWYLLAASAGLALVGTVHLAGQIRRPDRPGGQVFALVLGAMLASNLAISVAATASGLAVLFGGPERGIGGQRWDHLVYGRYIDAAVLILTVVGIVGCWDRARRGVCAAWLGVAGACLAVSAVALELLHGGRTLAEPLRLMVGGVAAFGGGTERLALAWWTAVALVTTLALVAAARRSTTAFGVVLAIWLATGAVGAATMAAQRHMERSQPDLTSALGPPGTSGDRVAVASDAERTPGMRLGVFAQQRELVALGWQVDFSTASGELAEEWAETDPAPAALLLLDGTVPIGSDWVPVSEHRDVTLWRRSPP
jgi:hypothetical protein